MTTHGGASPVEAVIFDWGGTLTPWHTVDVRAQWRETYAAHAHPEDAEAAEALAEALLLAEEHFWTRGREHHHSARIEDLLQHACAAAGVDAAVLDEDSARRVYEQWWEPHTLIDPQVRPLWTWLRGQGLKVGVLSNTIWSRDYHRGLFARDGVLDLIDGDVYTSEIDVVKPHPDAFRAAAAAVGVQPAHCVFVGDRLFEDVHGPQQVGMRAVHVPHSDIPAGQLVEVSTTPDAVAHELMDVVAIIRSWQGPPPAPLSSAQPSGSAPQASGPSEARVDVVRS